jgi:hypothetical protein
VKGTPTASCDAGELLIGAFCAGPAQAAAITGDNSAACENVEATLICAKQ